MQFGLDIPTTGAYADARVLAQLAADAEAAGWDGFFIWDVLTGDEPVIDPWIALTAIALQTSRIKIGLMVIPLARHRPWLVARRLANLDRLSNGRVICGVGLGYKDADFADFGENANPQIRAQQLDESLAILNGLWTQEQFALQGRHYTIQPTTLRPAPLQQPRIPLWVCGGWPNQAPFRRAARWDGACFISINTRTKVWLTLAEMQAGIAYVRSQRSDPAPFDIVLSGELPDDPTEAAERVHTLSALGATWWLEEGLGWTFEEFRERVNRGPIGTQ